MKTQVLRRHAGEVYDLDKKPQGVGVFEAERLTLVVFKKAQKLEGSRVAIRF